MGLFTKKSEMPGETNALPGRSDKMPISGPHFVLGHSLVPPFDAKYQTALFGMGCFWGAERSFWENEGIHSTAVGYSGGLTPNPTYEEVCTGQTGHNEVVLVIFDPQVITYAQLLSLFWESHNPTQGMRQGNDTGTQYRSGIYTFNSEQQKQAIESGKVFQEKLAGSGFGEITSEIKSATEFYYAEDYHQQYLAKVPDGYCGLGGTGVCYT